MEYDTDGEQLGERTAGIAAQEDGSTTSRLPIESRADRHLRGLVVRAKAEALDQSGDTEGAVTLLERDALAGQDTPDASADRTEP